MRLAKIRLSDRHTEETSLRKAKYKSQNLAVTAFYISRLLNTNDFSGGFF